MASASDVLVALAGSVLPTVGVVYVGRLAHQARRAAADAKRAGIETHRVVIAIDDAVNGRPPGSTTISEDVARMAEDVPGEGASP